MTVTRRNASSADAEFCRVVHHAAYRDVIERQYGEWDDERQDEFFAAAWSVGGYEILEWDDVPCGYCAIEDRPTNVYVRELVIAPEYQGRGIGTTIVAAAIQRARSRSVPVELQVLHQNRAGMLYDRLGFVEFDRTATHRKMRRQSELP